MGMTITGIEIQGLIRSSKEGGGGQSVVHLCFNPSSTNIVIPLRLVGVGPSLSSIPILPSLIHLSNIAAAVVAPDLYPSQYLYQTVLSLGLHILLFFPPLHYVCQIIQNLFPSFQVPINEFHILEVNLARSLNKKNMRSQRQLLEPLLMKIGQISYTYIYVLKYSIICFVCLIKQLLKYLFNNIFKCAYSTY